MRVCLFGTYNQGHSANRIVVAALGGAGFDVTEIHEPVWEATRDKDAGYFAPLGLLRLAGRYVVAAARLARRWHASGGAPVAVIGFNGQLDILLLRLLTPRYGPRIVFAPLVSLTETLVDDRRLYRPRSLGARLLGALDRLTCRLADVVVVDSEAHRRYFVDRLGVPPRKLSVCHLGVDDAVFRASDGDRVGDLGARDGSDRAPGGRADSPTAGQSAIGEAAIGAGDHAIEVLYFGQYLPLHGLDVVVDAVSRLSVRDRLRFVFIGTGPERARIEPQLRATRARVEFVNWVPYDRLPERIAQADIVLGVFGTSAKAAMVIPNKVYQAAAMGRAIVTADTPAVREVFSDGENIVLCRPDGRALAEAIGRVAADAEMRRRIGENARRLVAGHLSGSALARRWRALVEGLAPELAAPANEPLGVAILSFNDADSTLRCLEHLSQSDYDDVRILVVDNGSRAEERARLEQGMAGRFAARAEWLERNLGFAGGHNLAMNRLFDEGCRYVLLLNDDTIVAPEALRAMAACARRHPGAGPIGARIAADWLGAPAASLGERYVAALAWLPRTLVRVRRPRQQDYPVGGVMGCAMLVSRNLYDRLGGLDERFFAYYEEVDYCLRARRMGFTPRVQPAAEIAHVGHRGFGGGLGPASAYLKARNLWLLGAKHLGWPGWLAFAPGAVLLQSLSAAGYLLRGKGAVARAIAAGCRAGLRGEQGAPPAQFDPSLLQRASSGGLDVAETEAAGAGSPPAGR